MVHHVNGKFKDQYYHNQSGKVWEEIGERFDRSTDIYLAALDISTEVLDGFACGYGGPHGAFGGSVLIPASGWCFEEIDVTVILRVIDAHGNFTQKDFPLYSPEDLNRDGRVNIQNLVLVASNFGQPGPNPADVNGDRIVH